MAENGRFKLTNQNIEACCPLVKPPARRAIYWDAEIPGFGLVVGRSARSFIAQKDVGGRTVRVTIGRYGKVWTADRARKEAVQLLAAMDRGENPNRKKREASARGVTLGQAVDMHIADMRKYRRAERSILDFRDAAERHLGDWLKRPLEEITRGDCRARHERITKTSGPYAANHAFAVFRAAYNTAASVHDLPPNPVVGVRFNPVTRRREPIPWDRLAAWAEAIEELTPVRRDLHRFILFTGLRSLDARTVCWEHVNLGDEPMTLVVPNGSCEKRVEVPPGCIHRPMPKGGVSRGFTVPLSGAALDVLRRRKAENPILFTEGDGGWVFPTVNRRGEVTHVQEPKEQKYMQLDDGSWVNVRKFPSPHRLRDTFASACREAGVGHLETKLLMNHRLPLNPVDVTEGYQLVSPEHLRGCVERVAAFLLARMNGSA